MNKLFVLLLICFAYSSATDNPSKLLVSKTIINPFLVEKKDITILYEIYNIGSSAASDIELKDENFPAQYFELVMGSLSTRWSHLAPGSNLTNVAIVKPNSAGYFNFTSAYISYKAREDEKVTTYGYSTSPGELPIYSIKEFNRKFSYHLTEWISFCFICIPSLLIPFLLWHSSHKKYTAMASHKKSK